jgi:hypothetical protein
MTGIVFCDARGVGYKAARRPNEGLSRKLVAEEAEWLRTASTVPSIRRHVARFRAWHPEEVVLERECVQESKPPSYWRERKTGRLDRFELHREIERAMLPYGWSAPEYKEDSYRYARGRGWVLVDASMPHRVGANLVRRAAETLQGKRFYSERPTDVAFALRMESGKTVPPATAKRLSDRLLQLPDAEKTSYGGELRDPRRPKRKPVSAYRLARRAFWISLKSWLAKRYGLEPTREGHFLADEMFRRKVNLRTLAARMAKNPRLTRELRT